MQFKSLLFSGQRCKKVKSSKNDRFMYEMIGETQPEIELLVEAAFIYSLFAKRRQFNPNCSQNLILQHSIAGVCVQF